MTNVDFQRFVNILESFILKGDGSMLSENNLCESVLPLSCKDYRLHFIKSKYYQRHNLLTEAVNEITASILAIKDVVHGYHEPIIDNMEYLVLNGQKSRWFEFSDVYSFAGQVFAESGREGDAVAAYKNYFMVSPINSFCPSSLYSFRPINGHSLSDLINSEITVVHPSEFNDPFDTLLLQWSENLKKRNKGIPHLAPYLKAIDHYRVRSFVKDCAEYNVIKSCLMWSHYADEHKGFCIKYKFQEDFIKTTSTAMCFRLVNYKSEVVSIDNDEIDTNLAICTKHYSWNYENEVRLLVYLPDEDSHFCMIPMDNYCEIDAIYFGKRCSDKNILTIKNILKGMGVKFYKMDNCTSDIYNLIPVPC